MLRRTFVVVIDACGVGRLPDAWREGEGGASAPLHPLRAAGAPGWPAFASLVLDGAALLAVRLPARSFGAHA